MRRLWTSIFTPGHGNVLDEEALGHEEHQKHWENHVIPIQCDTDALHCRLPEARLLQRAGPRLPRQSTPDPAVSEAAAR